MSLETKNHVTLHHKVGTCPACKCGLWAWVVVEGRMSPPTLGADGKPHVYARAEAVHMTMDHECQPTNEDDTPDAPPHPASRESEQAAAGAGS